MYIAYMDECGNTGTYADPDQPIHFIGCLLVEENSIRPLEESVRTIAEKHFPDVCEQPRFEFHGTDMFAGKGFFKGSNPQTRIDATLELITAANAHAKFGWVGLNKIKSYAKDHPHRICFTLLAERLESWLQHKDSRALLVSDENKEVEEDLIRDIHKFKTDKTTWGYVNTPITRVVDSIHFVKSYNNPCIQVADVLMYIKQKEILTTIRINKAWSKLTDGVPHNEWKNYQTWLAEQRSRAEVATKQLCDSMDWPLFSKIWPD